MSAIKELLREPEKKGFLPKPAKEFLGFAAQIAAPQVASAIERLRFERTATPKQKRLRRHVETAIIAPTIELTELAEQIGVPLVKGEGLRGIDILGVDRSILEFPKAKKLLAGITKAGAKITPAAFPGLQALQKPISEAIEKVPEDIFAEVGRAGVKLGTALGLGVGITKGVQAVTKKHFKDIEDIVFNDLKERATKVGMPTQNIEGYARTETGNILSGRRTLNPEYARSVRLRAFKRFEPVKGEAGFARIGKKPISKELQPLIREAKRYKTAEEFRNAIFGEGALDISNRASQRWGRLIASQIEGEEAQTIKEFIKTNEFEWKGIFKDIGKTPPDISKGKITIWRAAPKGVKIEAGDWIALTKEYAEMHLGVVGREQLYKQEADIDDVIWAGTAAEEWIYAPKETREATKGLFGEQQLTDIWNKAQEEIPIPAPKVPTEGIIAPIKPIVEPIAEPKVEPIEVLQKAIIEAKPLSIKQKSLIKKEKSQRVAKANAMAKTIQGQKGFFAEIGSLKGQYDKVQFESIKNKISQEDIDSLFNQISSHQDLTYFDTINARKGLSKLFGEFGGGLPTPSELELLTTVFGKNLTDTLLNKRTWLEKIGRVALDVLNVPRALMASYDLSAPFRQGIFLIGSPKEFWGSFIKMFPQAFSQKYFDQLQKTIKEDPYHNLAQESGLSLTGLGSNLSNREEIYMSSLAEKIPLVGIGIRASERAYIGFLNKLRFDSFKSMAKGAEAQGLDIEENEDVFNNIAGFVNNATGRGKLPKALENSATALNAIFFSPRLHTARFRLLNPIYYAKLDPYTRKQALKSLFGFIGFLLTFLTLAKMSGAKVGTDPRSTDFCKIRIGDLRLDLTGGFQQIVVLLGRLITNQMKSSSTGEIYKLGEGYKPTTRLDVLSRYFTFKTAPVVSFMLDLMRGKTAIGEEFTIPKGIRERLTPLVIQDTIDIAKERPELLPFIIPAMLGAGIQYYKPRAKKTSIKGLLKTRKGNIKSLLKKKRGGNIKALLK